LCLVFDYDVKIKTFYETAKCFMKYFSSPEHPGAIRNQTARSPILPFDLSLCDPEISNARNKKTPLYAGRNIRFLI